VGSESPVTFSVHENLICAASDFFKKATSREWKESKERSIKLEHDAEVFQIYLHWLYRHTLPLRVDEPGLSGNTEYVQLANAYVLGDFLQDTHFKDAVIDAIIDKTSSKASDGQFWYPVGAVIRCIYDNTLESSTARQLLVDLYANHGHGSWLCDWATQEDLPKEFLFDVTVAVLDRRPKPPRIAQANPCQYHGHTPEQQSLCYRKKLDGFYMPRPQYSVALSAVSL